MPSFQLLLGFVIASGMGQCSDFIRVHLYNYAGVSGSTLAGAKGYASEVLRRAGVEVDWADCPTAACEVPISPLVLQVRIVDQHMAKKVKVTKACMGYAVLSGRFSSIAAVFYHKALQLEKDNIALRAQILGGLLAHEIGHLLLGWNSHSRTGIMRGVWERADLQTLARGWMFFTMEEAGRLKANARERALAARGAE